MVEGIYNTDRMKELTAKVYRLGIEFLYTAIHYYSMNAFRKMWHVVARPPSVQLNNKIVEIQDAIEDMRQEMRTLDAIRLEKIETDLGRTAAQVFQTAKDVEGTKAKRGRDTSNDLSHTRTSGSEASRALKVFVGYRNGQSRPISYPIFGASRGEI
jgi:hypothetical protein